MSQKKTMSSPTYEQFPMQINVKIYRPSVKGPILADASLMELNQALSQRQEVGLEQSDPSMDGMSM